MKRIKNSCRGLTFTVDDAESIGTKFRYVIDKAGKEILIISDPDGTGTVSRKKCGKIYKSLYDIRSREVRELVNKASFLEVESMDDRIVVHVYRPAGVAERVFSKDIVSIEDVLSIKAGEIVLARASGYGSVDCYGYRYENNIFDFISDNGTETDERTLDDVYFVASLFSGAGLLDYAFKDPKFSIRYAVDFDRDACTTYRENIGNHIQCRDIRDVKPEDIPYSDLWLLGSCCQGFSAANRRSIDKDSAKAKRELVYEFVRLAKKKAPNVFVLENVPQILTSEGGRYLNDIFAELSDYDITCKLIVDAEVGGYTARKRAIIIGSKIGKIELPDIKLLSRKTVREALSKIDASWYNFNDITVPGAETVKTMSVVPPGGNWRDIPEEIHRFGPSTQSNTYRRLSWDETAPTITNWRKCLMMPPVGNRILSVAEAASLMGLDKTFKICGRSLDSRQQQVGNGVTQAMAHFVKKYVLNALDKNRLKIATAS